MTQRSLFPTLKTLNAKKFKHKDITLRASWSIQPLRENVFRLKCKAVGSFKRMFTKLASLVPVL